MNELVRTHDLLFMTLDALRFDVAERCLREGRTPSLAARLGPAGWEKRHTPGTFTWAAHAAFFAGFLPTPARPGRHPRLFASRFEGSETTAPTTWTFGEADVVTALRRLGSHTICVGGVGFFNKRGALGSVFPDLFDESHWSPALGVTDPRSFEHQVDVAEQALARVEPRRRVFLFVNVSALHQPTHLYVPGARRDSPDTQAAALAYVDAHVERLFDACRRRGPCFAIVCSDHGTTYGEDGFSGHRLAHPSVLEVPYAELML